MDLQPPLHLLPSPSPPASPLTPSTPSTSSFPSSDRPRKPNPLLDLIDSERSYVDLLAGIIRKVAAAWSRSNLPPHELDLMFRSIEGIYKANRALSSKLKDIGTNPASPKALGDLLMRWIDDLNLPYSTYCAKYRCGFDDWPPVLSNKKLPDILSAFSAVNPSPTSSPWTLDELFLLPKARLKYYKKLYGRLLKSTVPGRSDHKLLVGAIETLERLLAVLDARSTLNVADSAHPISAEDEVVIDLRSDKQLLQSDHSRDANPGSSASSPRASSASGEERSSHDNGNTSARRSSTATLMVPITDLERRLLTERTLDIFTMQPKAVRLQMTPPSLTFTRELRFSGDVVIRFTSQATGADIIHTHGHIFLLSDLFLVCEHILPDERLQVGPDDPDMWLCYPPLSGKVLRLVDSPEKPTCFKIAIMRKETLVIESKSPEARNILMSHFKDCIEFAASLPPPSKQPPPPMPPLPSFARNGPGVPIQLERQNTMSPPAKRTSLPSMASLPPDAQPFHRPSMDESMAQTSRFSIERGLNQQPFHRVASAPDVSGGLPPGRGGPPLPQHPHVGFPPHQGQFGSLPNPPNSPGQRQGTYPPFQQPGAPKAFHPSPHRPDPQGFPPGVLPPRPSSASGRPPGSSISNRTLGSQYSVHGRGPPQGSGWIPPMPSFPDGLPPPSVDRFVPRSSSYGDLRAPQARPLLPSLHLASRGVSMAEPSFDEPSPPSSPVQETPRFTQPVTSSISATMKCKVFLQQQHAQWKSLGTAKLKLYCQHPTNIKQLVVEADNKEKSVLISTIVLTDGVERVGKTGVAIELSNNGVRTGIIYMLQLRNETSAGGLFGSLLEGSDRMTKK